MKIVLVTHAKTSNRPPRRLSMAGSYEVEQVVDMIKGKLGEKFRIQKAVSSPAARCLDTALLCLEEMGGEEVNRVETDRRLARLDKPDALEAVIRDNAQEGLAIFCHADLASVLPHKEKLLKVKEGWFEVKPVLVIMDWGPSRTWDENTVDAVLSAPTYESLIKE
ncbi:MAG TPA: phosphoglycerate mutase family protein [Nitrospirota bacterium]|nr:phosphoglycerate mutase family protein [Nitrospirota bacterium]